MVVGGSGGGRRMSIFRTIIFFLVDSKAWGVNEIERREDRPKSGCVGPGPGLRCAARPVHSGTFRVLAWPKHSSTCRVLAETSEIEIIPTGRSSRQSGGRTLS